MCGIFIMLFLLYIYISPFIAPDVHFANKSNGRVTRQWSTCARKDKHVVCYKINNIITDNRRENYIVVISAIEGVIGLQSKVFLLSQISEIWMCISRINKPIPGMFVLIWMHFSWWFQIWSWNFKIFIFLKVLGYFGPVVWSCLPRNDS